MSMYLSMSYNHAVDRRASQKTRVVRKVGLGDFDLT